MFTVLSTVLMQDQVPVSQTQQGDPTWTWPAQSFDHSLSNEVVFGAFLVCTEGFTFVVLKRRGKIW